MKMCARCSAMRPIEQFYQQDGTADGLVPYCRKCRRQMRRVGR